LTLEILHWTVNHMVAVDYPDWAIVIAVVGFVAAMGYILLGYWRGRR
jgi:hypothetical protein